ncbi:YolD-like family protein [Rummeliibacillus sp. NPDC094406]|uniref:YolD-like family protein n=1 Tax=Rummeliibacillus sp. NPDC094406 TaxID=3364511 RepID=UPI0037FB3F4C
MSNEEELYNIYEDAKLKDRGNIKWSMAMMMPEHVALLQKEREKENYITKPELDEWELEDMQQNLIMALNSKIELEYKVWNDGKFDFHRGVITRINEQTKEFYYSDPFLNIRGPINLKEVVDISPIDYREI